MTVNTLNNKLEKLGITSSVFDYNGYNKAIIFSINNLEIQAKFSDGKENIESFFIVTGYNNLNQERERRFFYSFNKVLSYAKR
jgi:hypothetical protein